MSDGGVIAIGRADKDDGDLLQGVILGVDRGVLGDGAILGLILGVVGGQEVVANRLGGEVVGVLVEGDDGGRDFSLGALVEEDFLEGVRWPVIWVCGRKI